ncbi:MAG TPA: sigma-54 dependent transcriptional regulator [Enhygromyxa sp.]|nr:sigma-54 dependent transcriptional regulator [Enhygromyxa sp.]
MGMLLTWSDRGVQGPRPAHHTPRPSDDRGPIARLLEHREYERARILCTPAGREPAEGLVAELRRGIADVELLELAVDDPSDYEQLFVALGPALRELDRDRSSIDVLLSAGTPQMQTLWVILVAAGLLRASMLQVIPAAFVPDPHPSPIREVRLDIEGFPEIRAMRDELRRLRAQTAPRGALIGESEAMTLLERRLARVARTDVPVLILGETGTGKELVARAVHAASERASGPFVAENCGSFSEGVLASELFGHERGAFTGANARRRGLFEQADGGTLLLDEIAETSARTQVMLLRVLQEGRLRRLGGEAEIRVDVRVLAATHRDLASMVAAGQFREDLYYRLRGATLELPPLRERGRDLELLVAHVLAELGRSRSKRGELRPWPTPSAWAALHRYRWPGNVRELRAEVVRWTVFCDAKVELDDLSPEIRDAAVRSDPKHTPIPLVQTLPEVGFASLAARIEATERAAVIEALEHFSGNLSAAARALEVDRNTLKRKLAKYDLRTKA